MLFRERQISFVRPGVLSIAIIASFAGLAAVRSADTTPGANGAATTKSEPKAVVPLERVGDEGFAVLRELFEYDRTIPLEARVVEQKPIAEDGSTREKIVLRTTRGCLVPAYLQLPSQGTAPFPCVLLMHGWSGSKENWYVDDNYIKGGNVRKALLAAGFAVFALDAQCHGDRISANDFAPVNHYVAKDAVNPRKGYFTLPEIYTQTVVDYRRAIDYLETRSVIDTKRIGIYGYSMGGTHSFLVTAVEPRVKVVVACAVPAEAKKQSLVAPQNYARGIGDRPFFMVMGNNDPLCGVEHARQLYAMIESPHTALEFFGGDHKLSPDFVPRAVDWLVKRL